MRSYRRCVAVLALAWATMMACNGRVTSTGAAASSAGGSAAGNTASSSAGAEADVGASGTAGIHHADADADGMDASPEGGSTCSFEPQSPGCKACNGGSVCTRVLECQSGQQSFQYQCVAGCWTLAPKACDPAKPHDSCPGTYLWCAETNWYEYTGWEEPMPCPGELPAPGSPCLVTPGGMDAPCGYPCDAQTNTGWTVASCSSSGTWLSDAACE